jgi:peptide/nickel transport system substrate-binding protein
VILLIAAGAYFAGEYLNHAASTSLTFSASSSSATTSTSASSSTGTSTPTTFTWETVNTPRQLDPQVSYAAYDYNILQNVYETLLWYSGTNGTNVIPWLAQNYTLSSDGKTANFTLRQGIEFADGEQLNSTSVYFSLNKLLIDDNSAPESHGTQASWIVQQLLNTSLSYVLSGPHNYTQAWANEVLAQNFVQITGVYTFTLHIQNPNAAFPYLFSNQWAALVAPDYVMQKDISLWNRSGYNLPYPQPRGNNASSIIDEYLMDEVATCDTGPTPGGCATTYLDGSFEGSLAGTGPYVIQSVGQSTNDIVLKVNPDYWGGPYQFEGGAKIKPTFSTVYINYVPLLETRELDLRQAADSGQAMSVDIPNSNLYDVANRTDWLSNGSLVSTMPGVMLYGPFTGYTTDLDLFATNVTDSATGTYYSFQPFADYRLRLAFADAVNMTEINQDDNNNLGQVAINGMPPGFPPPGTFDRAIIPRYNYNLTAVQNLLMSAMESPLTNFTFENGTVARPGVFNNIFGCTASVLSANSGTCKSPIQQSIAIDYPTGDLVDQSIMEDIATAVNNISSTYNMGLTVSTVPIPLGQLTVDGFSGYLYMWKSFATADYPWSVDFLGPLYDPDNVFTAPAGWNLSQMGNLFNEAVAATSIGNTTGLVSASDQMNSIANNIVMYLWTIYPEFFQPVTSNVHGLTYNPGIFGTIEYFANLT